MKPTKANFEKRCNELGVLIEDNGYCLSMITNKRQTFDDWFEDAFPNTFLDEPDAILMRNVWLIAKESSLELNEKFPRYLFTKKNIKLLRIHGTPQKLIKLTMNTQEFELAKAAGEITLNSKSFNTWLEEYDYHVKMVDYPVSFSLFKKKFILLDAMFNADPDGKNPSFDKPIMDICNILGY